MKIKEFIKKLESAKKSEKFCNNFRLKVIKYKIPTENTPSPRLTGILWTIRHEDKNVCKYCKTNLSKEQELDIEFHNPVENLTIFECGMLFSLFKLNRIVTDYAGWHNCKAGKEFIENIKSIR